MQALTNTLKIVPSVVNLKSTAFHHQQVLFPLLNSVFRLIAGPARRNLLSLQFVSVELLGNMTFSFGAKLTWQLKSVGGCSNYFIIGQEPEPTVRRKCFPTATLFRGSQSHNPSLGRRIAGRPNNDWLRYYAAASRRACDAKVRLLARLLAGCVLLVP